MGKKKKATSSKAKSAGSATPPSAAEEKKPSLRDKAVQAVAAIAAGVGSTIAARRKVSSHERPTPGRSPESVRPLPASQLPPFTHDDIARRAYFIAQERARAGQTPDATADWLQAERQLAEEQALSK